MYGELGFLRVFLCTIVSSYFIVKSLQLRGRRQIAEPRKYCLVRVIVFSICFVSHRLEFWLKFPTEKVLICGFSRYLLAHHDKFWIVLNESIKLKFGVFSLIVESPKLFWY